MRAGILVMVGLLVCLLGSGPVGIAQVIYPQGSVEVKFGQRPGVTFYLDDIVDRQKGKVSEGVGILEIRGKNLPRGATIEFVPMLKASAQGSGPQGWRMMIAKKMGECPDGILRIRCREVVVVEILDGKRVVEDWIFPKDIELRFWYNRAAAPAAAIFL